MNYYEQRDCLDQCIAMKEICKTTAARVSLIIDDIPLFEIETHDTHGAALVAYLSDLQSKLAEIQKSIALKRIHN